MSTKARKRLPVMKFEVDQVYSIRIEDGDSRYTFVGKLNGLTLDRPVKEVSRCADGYRNFVPDEYADAVLSFEMRPRDGFLMGEQHGPQQAQEEK